METSKEGMDGFENITVIKLFDMKAGGNEQNYFAQPS